ncbi:MAG TPA: hypothetical protein VK435_00895, partial [Thermodesulfovibrionales bacterium]|nr:hypothetical protein [Thermodesulfovibrionales bacterium]
MGIDAGGATKHTSRKKYIVFLFVAAILGLFAFFLRSQYISDALTRVIIPELEDVTGQRVAASRFAVNILPLYLEAKEMKISDESGQPIVSTRRVKGYVSLSAILNRQIKLQRLVIEDPSLKTTRNQLEGIISHVKAYLEKERETAFKVKIRVVEVVRGNISLRDENPKGEAVIKGLSGEYLTGEDQRLRASVKELSIMREGWPKILCDLSTSVVLKKDLIEVKQLEIGAFGSKFSGRGYYGHGRGVLTAGLDLIISSLKRMFHLAQSGEGRIAAKGAIMLGSEERRTPAISTPPSGFDLRGLSDISLDLKVKGEFYLQTLMELLSVKEKLEGFLGVDGTISGRLDSISGKGKARLQKGNLYGVDIDDMTCEVLYKNGVMDFKNGTGRIYSGTAEAAASIHLPVVDFFSLNVKFRSVDSKPVLNLIGWDPGIPPGKVDGELSSSGEKFQPDGFFTYKSINPEMRARIPGYKMPVDDVLNRVKDIKGNFSLRDDLLSLTNLNIGTPLSSADLNGTIDLAGKALNLKTRISTENVADFALPYYKELKGRGYFAGEVKGTFEDPKIDGRFSVTECIIEEYKSESAVADLSYRKNLLEVAQAVFRSSGEEHTIKGKMTFPEARYLFDLGKPVYDLRAFIRNAEFGPAVRIFYRDFVGTGRLSGEFRIEGRDLDPDIS